MGLVGVFLVGEEGVEGYELVDVVVVEGLKVHGKGGGVGISGCIEGNHIFGGNEHNQKL